MNADLTTQPCAPCEQTRQSLAGFRTGVDGPISALQSAARELLTATSDGGGRPTGVQIVIRVDTSGDEGAAANPSIAFAASTNCYTERYICGKGPTGYVYCSVDVCMTVGPITLEP